jgi:hypothetical protein
MAMERLACFGERETPRRTVDQAHAELALQRSDAAAKLRRLQAQRRRRRRIGAEIGDLGEEIEVVEVSNWGHGAAPIILSTTNMRSISRSVQRTIAQLPPAAGSCASQAMAAPVPLQSCADASNFPMAGVVEDRQVTADQDTRYYLIFLQVWPTSLASGTLIYPYLKAKRNV